MFLPEQDRADPAANHPPGEAMPYTLSVSEDNAFVIQTVTGELNRKVGMAMAVDAQAFGQQRQINRFLIDVTQARNNEGPFDAYEYAYIDMQNEPMIDRSSRIAMLVSPGDHSHDFVETVLRNAGHDVTMFTDRARAEEHLRR